MAATCLDVALFSQSDFSQNVWFGLPASGRLQIQLNGVISEITAAGVVSLAFQRGYNVLRLIAEYGDITMNAKLWGSDGTSMWSSLYSPGADPFLPGGGASSGSLPGSDPSSGSSGISTPVE